MIPGINPPKRGEEEGAGIYSVVETEIIKTGDEQFNTLLACISVIMSSAGCRINQTLSWCEFH